MRVLVAEDDPVLQRGLLRVLADAGHQGEAAGDGAHADLLLATEPYDLLVLDLGLPGLDGLDVLGRLRRRQQRVPVLILSARNRAEDRVRGLDAGADDYLTKPFDLGEFEARVRALMRRGGGRAPQVGRLTWVAEDRQLWCGDVPIGLTPHETAIVQLLMERPGRIVSKQALVRRLADEGTGVANDNLVEVYVHRLRRKLADAGVEIRTVRGMGYMLIEPPPPDG